MGMRITNPSEVPGIQTKYNVNLSELLKRKDSGESLKKLSEEESELWKQNIAATLRISRTAQNCLRRSFASEEGKVEQNEQQNAEATQKKLSKGGQEELDKFEAEMQALWEKEYGNTEIKPGVIFGCRSMEAEEDYGYQKVLDEVSNDFQVPFNKYLIGKYSGTGIDYANIDYSILDNLNAKYEELKDSILKEYTKEEAEKRIMSLNKALGNVYQENIIRPIYGHIDHLKTFFSEERMQFSAKVNHTTVSEADKATAKRVGELYDEITMFKDMGIGQYLYTDGTKKWLQSMVTSYIELKGTAEQKKEYFAMLQK